MVSTEGHVLVDGSGCRARRHHQDWFDGSDAATSNFLAKKSRSHNAYVNRPTDDNEAVFYRSHHLGQKRLREMQEALTARKADETQGYADRKEWTNFFVAIKAVYGPTAKGTAPLPSTNGSTQLTELRKLLHRWTEHFRGVLNHPSIISDAAITHLPQVETNVELCLAHSLRETMKAVQQLSSGKAPETDVCETPSGTVTVSTSAPSSRCTKQRRGQNTRNRRESPSTSTLAVFGGYES
nr:unnamed protein product [Spirometra erinaceieuropaei]